jgi:hypothetical protein
MRRHINQRVYSMAEENINLLGKNVTLRKTDGTAVRGLCVNQFLDSYVIDPGNGHRVAVLKINISEIIAEDFQPIPLAQTLKINKTKEEY